MTDFNPLNQSRPAGVPAPAPTPPSEPGRLPAHEMVELEHSHLLADDLRRFLNDGKIVTIISSGDFVCRIEGQNDGRFAVLRSGESKERMYVPGQQILVQKGEAVILSTLPVPSINPPSNGATLVLGRGGEIPCPEWVERVGADVVTIRQRDEAYIVERKGPHSVGIEILGSQKIIDYIPLELHPRRISAGGGIRLGGNWYLQLAAVEVGFSRPIGDAVSICAKSGGDIALPSFVPSRVRLSIRSGTNGSILLQDETPGFSSVVLRHVDGRTIQMNEPYRVSAELIRSGVELLVEAPGVPLARVVLKEIAN